MFSNIKAGAHIVGYKGNDNPWRDYLKKEITNNAIISGDFNPIKSLETLKKVSCNAFKSLVSDLSEQGINVGGNVFVETISPSCD